MVVPLQFNISRGRMHILETQTDGVVLVGPFIGSTQVPRRLVI